MKLFSLVILVTFFVSGCSSNDDSTATSKPDLSTNGDTMQEDGMPPTSTVLNRDNYINVVAHVLGIYASQPMRNSVYEPFEVLEDQVADSSSLDQISSIVSSQYTCSNGGKADARVFDSSATGFSSIVYDQCQIGDSVYDGEIEFNRSEGQSTKRTFQTYSIENATAMTVVNINGVVNQTNYICRSDNYQSWSTTDFSWSSINSNNEKTTVASSNAIFGAGTNCGNPWEANMNGGFTVSSPITNSTTIAASVSPDLLSTQVNDTNFQSGTMRLVSSLDESILVIKADNGDPESVNITLETPYGIETFNEPWITWQGILIPVGTGE